MHYLPLVLLYGGVCQEPLAHAVYLLGSSDFELYEAANVYGLDALETEGGERPADGLALGVQYPLFRPYEDSDLHCPVTLWSMSA